MRAAKSQPGPTHAASRTWRKATIAFLRGELDQTPLHGGPPEPETAPLSPDLIELNQAGFVTTESQPGAIDPAGPQRAFVEGLCSAATATRVEHGLLGTDLVVLSFAPGTSAWGSIVVTVDDGEPFTFLGRHDPAHVLNYMTNGTEELDEVLKQAWVLQVFDPVWGP